MTGTEIFFMVFNIKTYFEKSKMKNEKFKMYAGSIVHWNRQPDLVRRTCGAISDSINMQFFTKNDVKNFMLLHYAFSDDILKWQTFKADDIKKSIEIFDKKNLIKDRDFILEVIEKLRPKTVMEKLNPIHDRLYKINPDGKNYLYALVINKYIAPITFARMYKDCIFKLDESKLDARMLRFIKTMKQITREE